MKLAVIGTGYWGKNHVRALNELCEEGMIDELCICDTDKKTAETLASNYDIKFYTDTRDIPDDIDAVVVATPSDSHYSIARDFLAHDIDVLVEKPMTMTGKESDELIHIAETHKRILMAGHIFRYHAAVNELKKKIEKGDFGTVYYMMSNRFSLRYPRRDMGVLLALGVHEVDIFCHLLGAHCPSAIFAATGTYLGHTEETAQLITYFDHEIKGYAFESWLTPVFEKRRELVVVGSRMSAFVDYLKPNEITYYDAIISSERVTAEGSYRIPIEYREPLKEELKDFIYSIKTRKQPVANMYVGKVAVDMIEKAFESAKNGKKMMFCSES